MATTADSQICQGSHLRSPSDNHGIGTHKLLQHITHVTTFKVHEDTLQFQIQSSQTIRQCYLTSKRETPMIIMKPSLRPGHFMSMMPTLVSSSNPAVFTQASKWDLTTAQHVPNLQTVSNRAQLAIQFQDQNLAIFGKFKVSYHDLPCAAHAEGEPSGMSSSLATRERRNVSAQSSRWVLCSSWRQADRGPQSDLHHRNPGTA